MRPSANSALNQPIRALAIAAFVGFLLTPLLPIVPVSFSESNLLLFPPTGFTLRWYESVIGDPRWIEAAGTSLLLCLVSATLATGFAFATAYWMAFPRARFKNVVALLILLPVVIPAPVMALGYYLTFNLTLKTSAFVSLAIAYTIGSLPYAFVPARIAFVRFPVRLEEAAQVLGASPWQAFVFVRLKAAYRFLAAAFTVALLVCLDDVVFAFFLADAETRTLNLLIWEGVRTSLTPAVAVAATLLVGITGLAALGVRRLAPILTD